MAFIRDDADPKFVSQFLVAEAAMLAADPPIELEIAWSNLRRGGYAVPDYVYEKNTLLVRATDVGFVRSQRPEIGPPVPNRGVRSPDDDDSGDIHVVRYDGDVSVADMVSGFTERSGALAPLHILSICPVGLCPADEPAPVAANAGPFPAARDASLGRGVTVRVIDTGLVDGFERHSWLHEGVDGGFRNPFKPSGAIRQYAAHGQFVTGVLKCIAPGTSVHVSNALQFAGAATEDTLGQALLDALAENPHIISLSAGGNTFGGDPHAGLGPFRTALAQVDCTTLLVAAAGNDGLDQPFFPAAYATELPAGVVSVGAMRQDGQGRACFSNHGSWVRTYAAGERFVNAFLAGDYSYVDPQPMVPPEPSIPTCRYYPDHPLYCSCTCFTAPPKGATVTFDGMARWSGTSFSTPLVAGLIAAYMSEHPGMSARAAAAEVLTTATDVTDVDGVQLSVLTVPDGPAVGSTR